MVSTENFNPNSMFIEFYRIANDLGLNTKVHAGEKLGAEYIKKCIQDFNPKEIQHGIRIVEDKSVMQLAKEKKIIFNICPTSNLILGYVKNIKNYPIKKMFDFGLRITVGTDDFLYFNSDINNEYLKLYENKVFNVDELNEIRISGISMYT